MLARIAENIYWMARYIERAENTARLINVTTNLVLDLPRRTNVGWEYLVERQGTEELYDSLYEYIDEKSILKFLISDNKNPKSILNSLQSATEHASSLRDIIPREAWEQINNLYSTAKLNVQSGFTRKNRHLYLHSIILGAQTITGQLAGTMYQDAGYDMLRMGRNLERADMTTRIIDVRSADLLEDEHEDLTPFDNLQWVSVLKSLTGYQMYRRIVQVHVQRREVLKFLFQERKFPRSFYHSMCEVESCLLSLPKNQDCIDIVNKLQRFVIKKSPEKLLQDELHIYIYKLQFNLNKIHTCIARTYFISGT